MIGNDIIDISEAERKSNWLRKGFLDKVLTKKEQSIITNSFNAPQKVWLFWSMKESAYKIYVRQNLERFFSPLKFECNLIAEFNGLFLGEVLIKDITYKTVSHISAEQISTIALLKYPAAIGHQAILQNDFEFSKTDYYTQHQEIYKYALRDFSEKVKKPVKNLSIEKDEFGIPHLYYKKVQLFTSISLSHHGRYGAYAIFIN